MPKESFKKTKRIYWIASSQMIQLQELKKETILSPNDKPSRRKWNYKSCSGFNYQP